MGMCKGKFGDLVFSELKGLGYIFWFKWNQCYCTI